MGSQKLKDAVKAYEKQACYESCKSWDIENRGNLGSDDFVCCEFKVYDYGKSVCRLINHQNYQNRDYWTQFEEELASKDGYSMFSETFLHQVEASGYQNSINAAY